MQTLNVGQHANPKDFWVRPLNLAEDMPLVHKWVTAPRAHYWGLSGQSLDEVTSAYQDICSPEHVDAWIGMYKNKPAFLLETYDPAQDRVGQVYAPKEGDRGMHVLVAPSEVPIRGFTKAIFQSIIRHIMADPTAMRIVVEPDVRNSSIRRRNVEAGFVEEQIVVLPKTQDLPEKKSMLSIYNRETPTRLEFESDLLNALSPDAWDTVVRKLLAKAIAELSHERIISPENISQGQYRFCADKKNIVYEFSARVYSLDHWLVAPESIRRLDSGAETSLNVQNLILDLRQTLGMSEEQIPMYLEELNATLVGDAHKLKNQKYTARQLINGDMQAIEASMTQGHPCFIANNARLGFDNRERIIYAPEFATDIRLVWLAVHKKQVSFWAIDGVSHQQLIEQELPICDREKFSRVLEVLEVSQDEYIWVPAHPWQWENRLISVFSDEIARREIVFLGRGSDGYQPQQSIRTLFNREYPKHNYVKCSLSILNMGFFRGLSAKYMSVTPAINRWVDERIRNDPYLRSLGFEILREVAAVGVSQPQMLEAAPASHQVHKLLAALWRESPFSRVEADRSLATMASLLHIDRDGRAFVAELILQSEVSPEDWLRAYLNAYFKPLLHCFYAHDMVFMPHGENLIIVLDRGVPERCFIKDIAEEVALFSRPGDLPDEISRIAVDVPEHIRLLSIFTDVFDCFFRFLAPLMAEQAGLPESTFWKLVAESVHEYQASQPNLKDKFQRFDLFAPEFLLSCLNRLQFANNSQLIDLANPADALQFAGNLDNPISSYRENG